MRFCQMTTGKSVANFLARGNIDHSPELQSLQTTLVILRQCNGQLETVYVVIHSFIHKH